MKGFATKGHLLVLLTLAGCQSAPAQKDMAPRRQFISAGEKQYAREQFAVYDPVEGTNKEIYKFNAKFDDYVFLPVIDAYKAITPEFVRTGVTNFFSNIGEFENFTNAALQGKAQKATTTVWRFVINTTAGLLGTIDVATKMGVERQQEDFGQTLGVWGVGPGPYLVVPILGPSNLRDLTGRIADGVMLSLAVPNDIEDNAVYDTVMYGVRTVDARANNDFRYYSTGSPFEYELIRYVVNEARQLQVEK